MISAQGQIKVFHTHRLGTEKYNTICSFIFIEYFLLMCSQIFLETHVHFFFHQFFDCIQALILLYAPKYVVRNVVPVECRESCSG